MTSARSGNASPIPPDARAEHHQAEGNRDPGYRLSPSVGVTREIQLDRARSWWELDADERVVSAPNARRRAIGFRFPAGIVVLGDNERRPLRRWRAEIDLYFARLVVTDGRHDRERR